MRVAYLAGAMRISTAPDAEVEGGRLVRGVIQGFRRAGWDVESYIAGDRPWGRLLAARGRQATVQSAVWRAAVADLVRVGASQWNRWAAPRAIGTGVDLAYERYASFQALGTLFKQRGCPWVLETHGPFYREAKEDRRTLAFAGAARRQELAAYRSCDMLVCVSEPLRRFLVAEGVPEALTYLRPNGVDVELFDPRAAACEPPADVLRVGYVGSLLEWQGLDVLLQAVAAARASGHPVEAEIVGAGRAEPQLRRMAHALAIDASVRFRGNVPWNEVPTAMAAFDVGFAGHVPLLDGTMYHSPLKLYEYAAMGKTIVSTRHPEAVALVRETGSGYLFDDLEELTLHLAHACDHVADLRARRDDIRAVIVSRHTWERRIADMLKELASRGIL